MGKKAQERRRFGWSQLALVARREGAEDDLGGGGAGAVLGRRCRPAVARPRWEWVGSSCVHGRRRTGEFESPTSGPGATIRGGWVKMV
jgi:hypothetical protein